MLTDKLCVKYGQHIRFPEAAKMRFKSQHTSIQYQKCSVLLLILERRIL